jgi:hypothetical protein
MPITWHEPFGMVEDRFPVDRVAVAYESEYERVGRDGESGRTSERVRHQADRVVR